MGRPIQRTGQPAIAGQVMLNQFPDPVRGRSGYSPRCGNAEVYGLLISKNGLVLAEAIVGWVVEVVGDRTLSGVNRSLFGAPDRRALASAVDAAMKASIADLPEDAREAVLGALAERFTEPPAIVLDARKGVRDAIVSAVREQIAPLADPRLTGTGRSFFEEVGVDSARLRDDLPIAVIRAVEQVATRRPALAPLAAQLNADALLAEVRGLRQDYGRSTPAEVNPEPRARESQPQIFAVVDALLTLEAIADEGARREVLRLLPAEIAGAIPHHAIPRVQVLAIVRTCLSYEGGLRELLEAVRVIERDSVGMRELDDTMNSVFPGYLAD
jgi:Effector-associated domain 2